MKITCGSCSAKYTVSDEKVQGKTVKIKCRKCGAVIVVSSTGEVQTTGGEGGAAAELGDGAYTVSVTDSDQRNMTMAEIVSAYNEGTIDAETFVWADGMDDWKPLKDVDAIVDALHDAAAADGAGGEEDLGSTVAMSDSPFGDSSAADALGSLAAGGAAVAATAPGGPSFDMGGGAPSFDNAGPDFGSTVALSSAPEEPAAAAPAGGSGGFFDMAGSSASLNPGPAAGAPAAGGEENSAIFSLSMLTQKVGDDAGGADASTTEDSGLIDLKALAAGVGSQEPAAAPVAAASATDGVFPLGAPAPAPAPAAPVVTPSMAPEAQKSGNRGLVIGLAAAVVVLGAALIFFVVKGDDPKTTADGTTAQPNYTAAPAEPKTPEPEKSAEPVAAADPAASASAAPSASASADDPSKVAAAPNPNSLTKPAPGTQPPPTTTKKKTPPKPTSGARGPCGCASDDLMCNMRCARKGKKKKKKKK